MTQLHFKSNYTETLMTKLFYIQLHFLHDILITT